jgi:hypothetical protein
VYRGERSGRICGPRMCGRGGAFSVFFISKIKRVGGWMGWAGGFFFFFSLYLGVRILGDWPIR